MLEIEEYKKIMMKDIYDKLCEILQNISNEYNLNFDELHDLYLINFT